MVLITEGHPYHQPRQAARLPRLDAVRILRLEATRLPQLEATRHLAGFLASDCHQLLVSHGYTSGCDDPGALTLLRVYLPVHHPRCLPSLFLVHLSE